MVLRRIFGPKMLKLSLCFNSATTKWMRIGEWRYSSTRSWPWHYTGVSGQLYHQPAERLSTSQEKFFPIELKCSCLSM